MNETTVNDPKSRGLMSRSLLACGVIGPPLFVLVFLIEGATRPGYNPWRNWVSELSLGELGWMQIANFIVFGLLALGFAIGLRQVLRIGRGSLWGPILVAAFGLCLILAGIFVTNSNGSYPPGAPRSSSLSGTIHDIAGPGVFVSVTAACFVLARRFAGDPDWKGWARYSVITGVVVPTAWIVCAVLAGLDYGGVLLGAPSGLFQRLSLVAGCAWVMLLALRLMRERPPAAAATAARPRGEIKMRKERTA